MTLINIDPILEPEFSAHPWLQSASTRVPPIDTERKSTFAIADEKITAPRQSESLWYSLVLPVTIFFGVLGVLACMIS